MGKHDQQSQFDTLAMLYEDMVNWPFRKEVEIPAVLERLGNISGLDILDFGCGAGHYSRLLKSQGAARVVGYDVSGGMLQHAQERETTENLGIEYVSDLAGLASQFDLVLGVYVLPFAATRAELLSMIQSMVMPLRPGGRLLTLPFNPDYAPSTDYYLPYGIQLIMETPHQDGGKVHLLIHSGDQHVDIIAYYWSKETLEHALQQSGLSRIQWQTPYPKNRNFSATSALNPYLQRPQTIMIDSYYHGNHTEK